MVQSTAYSSGFPASSVLILAEEDGNLDNGNANYWLGKRGRTWGQGFTLRVDLCARMIAGVQIKNTKYPRTHNKGTKGFRLSASLDEFGRWETLGDYTLPNPGGNTPTLLNFTFGEPVELQFLKFDLISFWGDGGGLQYFAAIPVTSEYEHNSSFNLFCKKEDH